MANKKGGSDQQSIYPTVPAGEQVVTDGQFATIFVKDSILHIRAADKIRGEEQGQNRKGPPKFKQRQTRQFKSKPPKKGVQGFGDDIPGMEGLGTDITVICPWEAFSHLELHELAQYGII
ncbi:hypothetical protein JRQ81_002021 [Phrynocephalus forsythii]|uniref:3',5'-cyclic-GMP phosphodiesterase n=1 Tax=Phrynocephalus forsythii TaxID=171643 RepID=A0A9Q0XH42_9SAUR|nr:hypothetical protein JRQ81_002021 [Phrynocephalus forsythii]